MKTLLTDRALPNHFSGSGTSRFYGAELRRPRVRKRKNYVYRAAQVKRKLVRRMLGQYPIMTLAEAREAALAALRDIARGGDGP